MKKRRSPARTRRLELLEYFPNAKELMHVAVLLLTACAAPAAIRSTFAVFRRQPACSRRTSYIAGKLTFADRKALLEEEQVTRLFAWVTCAFRGDERYNDLRAAFTAIFSDNPGPRLTQLLADAMKVCPREEEAVGEPFQLADRVQASLGAMGAAQWTGRFKTRPHALLDVRELNDVDEWRQRLSRGARRTLAKADAQVQNFAVTLRPIRGGEPAPHSSLACFRAVCAHEVRLLADDADDVLEALSVAISRYIGTTRMAGEVRVYRDATTTDDV
jgi:hypothetical protein